MDTDRWMIGRQMDGWKDGWMNRQMEYRQTDGRVGG